MVKDYAKFVLRLMGMYTQEEVEAMLGVGYKSIENYKKGTDPTAKVKNKIEIINRKLSENGWKPLPLAVFLHTPKKVSSTDAILKVLIHEFAILKAEKGGVDIDKIKKDIMNKAKLVLDASEGD